MQNDISVSSLEERTNKTQDRNLFLHVPRLNQTYPNPFSHKSRSISLTQLKHRCLVIVTAFRIHLTHLKSGVLTNLTSI